MVDVILDTLLDAIKILPFLFLTYLAMEYIEHKTGDRAKSFISNSGKLGPVYGGLCGAFPQCGFSAAASSLYAGRVITVGTLVAVFLSTSDEMLPIMISEKVSFGVIATVIGMKIVYGIIIGFVLDFAMRKPKKNSMTIHSMCEHENCHCEKGILRSAIHHSIEIIIYIIIISFVLNTVIYLIGEDALKSFILDIPVLGEAAAGLIGLIPNCAASVVITELYIEEIIPFGTMMSGLFVGAGVGLLILFRTNKKLKENLLITAVLFASGVIGGIIINLFGITL